MSFSDSPSSAGETELCIRDYDSLSCGADDGSGFSMKGPSGRDFVVDLSNSGFAPHILQHRIQAAKNFQFPLLSTAAIAELEDVSGTTALGSKGTVLVYVSDGQSGLSGVDVQLQGSGISGTYYSNLAAPDDLLSNTSGNGYVAFVGVDPGSYRIYVNHPLDPCGSFYRGVNEDGFFEVLVEAGTVTHAGEFECSERIDTAAGEETG